MTPAPVPESVELGNNFFEKAREGDALAHVMHTSDPGDGPDFDTTKNKALP